MLVSCFSSTKKVHAMRGAALHSGFSLMEMLIVLSIMASIIVIAIPSYRSYVDSGRKTTANATLRQLKTDILRYYSDTNHYPETLQDLVKEPTDENVRKKWSGPYLNTKKVPLDPWGDKYIYRLTPDAENPYELYTRGAKKKSATKKDWISAWDEQ